MISIEKLIAQLQQCRDTQVKLPSDNDNSLFIQKTALDIRKFELEAMYNQTDKLGKCAEKYIEYQQNSCTMNNQQQQQQHQQQQQQQQQHRQKQNDIVIPPKSLIVYIESECAALPEILSNIFKILTKSQLSIADWYIYGVKNPESFYKSFLHLININFIIKNRTDKKNEIATFKREMALQYETFYKELNYRKYHFNKLNMVSNLTNEDNYTGIDIFQYICDYTKTNMIILDIIEEQYIEIKYTSNTLCGDYQSIYNSNYICIIKYANNTFLPLMHTLGKNGLPLVFIEFVRSNFELMKFKGFIQSLGNDGIDGIGGASDVNKSDKFSNSKSFNIVPTPIFKDIKLDELEGDLTNLSNSANSANQANPINIIMVEEDMIMMEEETADLDTNYSGLTDAQSKSIEYRIPKYIVEDEHEPMSGNLQTRVYGANPISIDKLMEKIPTINNSKEKGKPVKISKANTGKVTIDTLMAADNSIANSKAQQSTQQSTQQQDKEVLKPLKQCTLLELQMLSRLYKLPTQKTGSSTKMINKTKEELHTELAKHF